MASQSSGLLVHGHGHDRIPCLNLLVSQHRDDDPARDGDNGESGDFDGNGDGSALEDLLRIIPFLPPKEVCKLSSMCKTVRAVADSDHVWANKVPIYPGPDVAPDHLVSQKKKKTYFYLRSDVPQVRRVSCLFYFSSVSSLYGTHTDRQTFLSGFRMDGIDSTIKYSDCSSYFYFICAAILVGSCYSSRELFYTSKKNRYYMDK